MILLSGGYKSVTHRRTHLGWFPAATIGVMSLVGHEHTLKALGSYGCVKNLSISLPKALREVLFCIVIYHKASSSSQLIHSSVHSLKNNFFVWSLIRTPSHTPRYPHTAPLSFYEPCREISATATFFRPGRTLLQMSRMHRISRNMLRRLQNSHKSHIEPFSARHANRQWCTRLN